VQDVPQFVRRKEVGLFDYLDNRVEAVIDSEHCVRLNYETYFFGDLWTKERFRSDPVMFCGLLTDPVSRERFRPSEDSPRSSYEKVTYYFQDRSNRDLFELSPMTYRLPSWSM
jgi:YHS domain-containing protein